MTTLLLHTNDGTEMDCYLAEPDGPALGAVIVIQEAFGLTDHIKEVTDRVAQAGYVGLAPALFHRTGSPVLGYDNFDEVIPNMGALSAEGIAADLEAACDELVARGFPANKTAIVGFCMGGAVALFAATTGRLAAAVTFYGGGVTTGRFGLPALVDQAPHIVTPWLGLYGDLDKGIPTADVEALRDASVTAPAPTMIVRYDDADHGFHCNDRPQVFHEAAAADAWARTLAWFETYLGD